MNNLPQIFFQNSELYENKTLFGFKTNSNWEYLSWKETKELVLNISSALYEIGVKKNDKISIIAENSYKWCVVDLATISLGAITVPGYTTSNEKEISHVLSHSETSIVFTNEKLLSLILKILPDLDKITHVICIDDINTSRFKKFNITFHTFNQLLDLGSKSDIKSNITQYFITKIDKNDVVSIIYTSGTSNKPKGVM
jgi:Long-chain acyl-CoA synthetases (AMP-forming)